MPALRKPATGVIGAGISGRTAGKMLGDYGVPYTCFGTSDRVGGSWALVLMGFAQAVPTLFPFVEAQARLLAACAVDAYALPGVDEMERAITADERLYLGHVADRLRHTQQVDYFVHEHDLRTRELPAGRRRAEAVA